VTWVFVSPWFVRQGEGTALLDAAVRALIRLGYSELVPVNESPALGTVLIPKFGRLELGSIRVVLAWRFRFRFGHPHGGHRRHDQCQGSRNPGSEPKPHSIFHPQG
jgi:hypothetical protein